MKLVDDPDERVWCPPAACRGCGAGLERVPVAAQRWRQVTDIAPALTTVVTEFAGAGRGVPVLRLGDPGRARRVSAGPGQLLGPETCAHAANLGGRPTISRSGGPRCCCASSRGITVSTGWMAGVRRKAADLVESSRIA